MWIQTHWRVLPTTCRTCPVMWWISTNTNSQNTNSFVLLTWRTSCAFSLLFLNHSNAWANAHTCTHVHTLTREKPSLPLSLVVLQYLGKLISSYIKASALDCCSEVSKYVAAAFNHFFFLNHYISKACLFCPPSGTFSLEEKHAGFSWRYREEGDQLSVSIFPSHLPPFPLLN